MIPILFASPDVRIFLQGLAWAASVIAPSLLQVKVTARGAAKMTQTGFWASYQHLVRWVQTADSIRLWQLKLTRVWYVLFRNEFVTSTSCSGSSLQVQKATTRKIRVLAKCKLRDSAIAVAPVIVTSSYLLLATYITRQRTTHASSTLLVYSVATYIIHQRTTRTPLCPAPRSPTWLQWTRKCHKPVAN